jgi:hypothetical protein
MPYASVSPNFKIGNEFFFTALCQTKKSGRYQRDNQKPSNIHIYSYKSTWHRDIEDGQTIQQPKEKYRHSSTIHCAEK